jgi:hypothetical protein
VTSLRLPILASDCAVFSAVNSCLQQEQFRRSAASEFVPGMDAYRLDHRLDLGAERRFPKGGGGATDRRVRRRQLLPAVRVGADGPGTVLLELRVGDLAGLTEGRTTRPALHYRVIWGCTGLEMVSRAGLEPATTALKGRCSTN